MVWHGSHDGLNGGTIAISMNATVMTFQHSGSTLTTVKEKKTLRTYGKENWKDGRTDGRTDKSIHHLE